MNSEFSNFLTLTAVQLNPDLPQSHKSNTNPT